MGETVDRPFIHFHIPKTAGTSLRSAFTKQYGPEGVAFRLHDGQLVRISELPFANTERLDKIRRVARRFGLLNLYSAGVHLLNRGGIRETFDISTLETQNIQVATGHFTHNDITETVMHLPRTTLLREPLARAWSHYGHWREAKGNMWWHSGDVPYADDVSFETFATDPALANFQAKHLGDLGFVVIGTTTDLPGFFEEIGLNPGTSVPKLNPGQHQGLPDFDPGFRRDFAEINAVDYALYEAAAHKA